MTIAESYGSVTFADLGNTRGRGGDRIGIFRGPSILVRGASGGTAMHVEECCQALLAELLPLVDRKRKGVCLEVGVGTFAFYCEMFSQLGFRTIAVEPLPVEALRLVCKKRAIQLMETCLSDSNGVQSIFLGRFRGSEDVNLSSLLPNWWGASDSSRPVPAIDLRTLLTSVGAREVTCIKLDVEGMESKIIRQFSRLPTSLLPKVVLFEYGGGDTRESGRGGWAQEFLDATMESLHILRQCGYTLVIVIDAAIGSAEKMFDLRSMVLDPEQLFHPRAVYGNIIAVRDVMYEEIRLRRICEPYRNNNIPPPPLRLPRRSMRSLFRRLGELIRSR